MGQHDDNDDNDDDAVDDDDDDDDVDEDGDGDDDDDDGDDDVDDDDDDTDGDDDDDDDYKNRHIPGRDPCYPTLVIPPLSVHDMITKPYVGHYMTFQIVESTLVDQSNIHLYKFINYASNTCLLSFPLQLQVKLQTNLVHFILV